MWHGGEAIPLSPKAFSVLLCLAEHPGQLVTKQELLETVWPRGFVTDGVLKVCIREIRGALGDPPKASRFIETLHRRGYRLIADLRGDPAPSTPPSIVDLVTPSVAPIGREKVLADLGAWLDRASQGQRQVVFVSGEAGIGKTAVVDAFVESAAAGGWLVGRGQCIEQYGASEPYFPVLEALNRICHESTGAEVLPLLSRYAPSWLAHLPWLSDVASPETPKVGPWAPTRERMLREMAELLEALTASTPLALVLEDLHWGDYSTLDLVSMLARRRGAARLLVLITYRPVEVILADHPLKAVKQDLQVRGCCEDLPLSHLSAAEVGAYLEQRFPAHSFPPAFAAFIHERTEGNPLFMLNVVDYLLAQGSLVADEGPHSGRFALRGALGDLDLGVPESLRQMIERQVERHNPEEQRVLEAASVAGQEFTPAAVAAVLEIDEVEIDACLASLARRGQLVHECGVEEWPDITVSASYAFAHALYQNALYARQPAARRMQSHRRVGVCLERAYGSRVTEIVSELALHFEQGRDYPKAVHYLRQAAANAAARYANREAEGYLVRALALPSDAATRCELMLLRGERLRDLGSIGESVDEFRMVLELANHAVDKTRAWVGVATSMQVMDRHHEALDALRQAEAALAGQALAETRAKIHYLRGNAFFTLGDIERCLGQHEHALAYAREAGSPKREAQALSGLADAYYLRGRMRTAYEHFDRCIELCRKHGFARIEVSNLAMRGLTRAYQNDTQAALEDCLAAAEMAVRMGDLRAEMLARENATEMLRDLGDWRGMQEQAEQSLALARRLSARGFEALTVGVLGAATAALGDRAKGEKLLREAYSIGRESGLAFAGPLLLGELALVATDADTCRWALSEGEKLLRDDCISHNFFFFYRDAMEACLQEELWSEVERYAHALEDYTRAEPLPWSDFKIARGRALAAHGRGARDETIYRELQRLRGEAERAELKTALPAIEKALSE